MSEAEKVTNYNLLVESRLTRAEVNSMTMQDDIKEIKRNVRWLMGLVFSVNSTIVGLLIKLMNAA